MIKFTSTTLRLPRPSKAFFLYFYLRGMKWLVALCLVLLASAALADPLWKSPAFRHLYDSHKLGTRGIEDVSRAATEMMGMYGETNATTAERCQKTDALSQAFNLLIQVLDDLEADLFDRLYKADRAREVDSA